VVLVPKKHAVPPGSAILAYCIKKFKKILSFRSIRAYSFV